MDFAIDTFDGMSSCSAAVEARKADDTSAPPSGLRHTNNHQQGISFSMGCDRDCAIDLQGGTNDERLDLLREIAIWFFVNGSELGTIEFCVVWADEGDVCGGVAEIAGTHCTECASRRVRAWLLEQGLAERSRP